MLMIRRRGITNVEPALVCDTCHQVMPLGEAWLGFLPLSEDCPQRPVVWVHRTCASALTLFETNRMVLWRARDCVERLMRQTELVRKEGR